jgi:hypothetical protein
VTEAWDEAAWQRLAAELRAWQEAGRVATFWWRDDDAGPPDPALDRLLRLATTAEVPLGLAVVPAWLDPAVADQLRAAPAAVAILQHGTAHANHETAASQPGARKVRPAECGPARPAAVVLAELAEGWQRLAQSVGPRGLPVFVPPWNRIAPAVTAGLPAAGYRALSTFGPRPAAEAAPGLRQVNCHADPIVWREAKRFAGAAATLDRLRAHLADRREGRADRAEPTGLLTHHHALSPEGWAFLEGLVERLRRHSAGAFPPIAALIEPEGQATPAAAPPGAAR